MTTTVRISDKNTVCIAAFANPTSPEELQPGLHHHRGLDVRDLAACIPLRPTERREPRTRGEKAGPRNKPPVDVPRNPTSRVQCQPGMPLRPTERRKPRTSDKPPTDRVTCAPASSLRLRDRRDSRADGSVAQGAAGGSSRLRWHPSPPPRQPRQPIQTRGSFGRWHERSATSIDASGARDNSSMKHSPR